MREKRASDLFQKFDVPISRTAFCIVYLDTGKGINFHGIYTLLEQVDNTVIKSQFSGAKGNLYKPEGEAATFAPNTFKRNQMNIKTNNRDADYADVKHLYNVINSDLRFRNNEKWKDQLEAIFDVDVFLRWLAANTIMQNWDAYGRSEHNFYLYNNLENNKLTWIPWDNNEAFSNMSHDHTFNFENMNNGRYQWPLISNILEVSEYKQRYNEYLLTFSRDVYSFERIDFLISKYHNLLNDFIELEIKKGYSVLSIEDFNEALDFLKRHPRKCDTNVNNYLQNQ